MRHSWNLLWNVVFQCICKNWLYNLVRQFISTLLLILSWHNIKIFHRNSILNEFIIFTFFLFPLLPSITCWSIGSSRLQETTITILTNGNPNGCGSNYAGSNAIAGANCAPDDTIEVALTSDYCHQHQHHHQIMWDYRKLQQSSAKCNHQLRKHNQHHNDQRNSPTTNNTNTTYSTEQQCPVRLHAGGNCVNESFDMTNIGMFGNGTSNDCPASMVRKSSTLSSSNKRTSVHCLCNGRKLSKPKVHFQQMTLSDKLKKESRLINSDNHMNWNDCHGQFQTNFNFWGCAKLSIIFKGILRLSNFFGFSFILNLKLNGLNWSKFELPIFGLNSFE